VAFEEFFRVANGVECTRSRADSAEADAAQAVHDATHSEEFLQIAAEALGRRKRDVLAREREFDSGLHQVITDGNFSAIGIATARGRKLFQIIGITLDQDGDVQLRHLQRVRDAFFVAEIRQANEDAVDLVSVAAEEFGAFASLGMCFNTTEFRIGLVELDGFNAEFGEALLDVPAGFSDQLVGEKVAVAVDDTENRRGFNGVFHERKMVCDKESFGGGGKQAYFDLECRNIIFSKLFSVFRMT